MKTVLLVALGMVLGIGLLILIFPGLFYFGLFLALIMYNGGTI